MAVANSKDKTVISIADQDNTTKVKVIQWEDLDHELTRFVSLSSALKEAKDNKFKHEEKLKCLIQVKSQSLSQSNELEEMRQKLEARKLIMEKMSTSFMVGKEDARCQEEKLGTEVRSLLVAGTSLSVAMKRLQESSRILSEEKGCVNLKKLQRKLRTRQQYMVSQVYLLYPVKFVVGPAQEQELESYPSGSKLGSSADSKPVNQGSLTISGLHLTVLPFTKMSFFTDKKEVQRSATALGYVAHAVSLIASYLHVPLRYPLRLGGSHSYITDYAPSIEPISSDMPSNAVVSANMKLVAFPLFLDGQDSTRAAYAVFLLNKDLEQLLNYIGVKSLGPRQVLANLKELFRTIQCPEFLDS
ncbi:hypothetical protein ACFE04_012117 [Oxalis oulophora]